MLRNIIVLLFIFSVLFTNDQNDTLSIYSQCNNNPVVYGYKIYTFSIDGSSCLTDPKLFMEAYNLPVKEILDSLASHLENTFFRINAGIVTNIHFDILNVTEINTPAGPIRIAVIDMIDPEKFALKSYFQGSYGASRTYCILLATFMQPYQYPYLLDGLYFLYNGKILSKGDHIDLEGLLLPDEVKWAVIRAFNNK
jgi:hypothetical protein